jgi:CubicO group peptidase (beta-lactamase class C family)
VTEDSAVLELARHDAARQRITTQIVTLDGQGICSPGRGCRSWRHWLSSAHRRRAGDVVPAIRPITVAGLLTFRAGYGFPSDFSLPVAGLLVSELKQGPPQPQLAAAPDDWMAALSRIPLLHQPGEAWLYNTCSGILGALIARVSGRPLPEFLAERLFEPLGMADTGFAVPTGKLGRFTSYYRAGPAGGLELVDASDGQRNSLLAFPSGAGGLVSTADDWHSFAQMLLASGSAGGRLLLSAESVRQMTTDQLTQSQRDASRPFVEGQG